MRYILAQICDIPAETRYRSLGNACHGNRRSTSPVLLSVRSGYEYLAVRDDGAVVHGAEPEFEEAAVVFPHFEALLRYIAVPPAERNQLVDRLLFDAST